MSGKTLLKRIDWVTVLLYLALLLIGWIGIYSSTFSETDPSLFNFNTYYGKQGFFITASLIATIFVFAIDASVYEQFSSIFYVICLILLIGLFPFGKTIAGATSWYNLGFFNLQPSEFTKVAVALATAKYVSDIQTDIKKRKDQLYAILILIVPVILVLLQPDAGSAIVFLALSFVLFREGFPLYYLVIALLFALIFITTLIFGTIWVSIGLAIIIALVYLIKKSGQKIPILPVIGIFIVSILFSLSVKLVYNHVFKQHHRDRFSLWLRLEKDPEKLAQIKIPQTKSFEV